MAKHKPFLIIISAPSGGGKSTIVNALLKADVQLYYSISATTRPKTAAEIHGVHYFFYSVDEFKTLIEQKMFAEWALVHDNYYGTLKSEIAKGFSTNRDVIMDIDVQGAESLRYLYPDCVDIFLLPPDLATLEQRIRNRKRDDEATIQKRLQNAKHELTFASKYTYQVINADLETCIADIKKIILSERSNPIRLS